jgi:hypothetical protein
MKKLIQICWMLCLAASTVAQEPPAQQVLRVYDWKDLMSQQPFPNSEIISMDGISVLKIQNTNHSPLEVSILRISDSNLIKKIDTIAFDVKFENVFCRYFFGGESYIYPSFTDPPYNQVLFSHSGNITGNEYGFGGFGLSCYIPPSALGGDTITNYSRIMFAGTSNWKRCNLRHFWFPSESLPTQVGLYCYLSGPGTVYLRPMKLLAVRGNWWSPQLSGWVGGIGGSVIGCFGGLIGCLAGMGKARRFVLATTKFFIALGILMTIAGIVAAVLKQPYSVWYTLLLPGGILTFVFSVNLYPINRRYDDLEIRRMASMDATGR